MSNPSGCGPGAVARSASARNEEIAPSIVSASRPSGTATGTPRLVKDIDTSGDSSPEGYTRFGDEVFFAASKPSVGRELWQTDGTYRGTSLVRDIRPGPEGSGLGGFTVAGGRLFFSATDGVHGYELWASDGTSMGTHLVKDIDPGGHSASPRGLISFGGRVYFLATTRSLGDDRSELWTSDGTQAGTHLVKDVDIRTHGDLPPIVATHRYLFFAGDGGSSLKLWRSNGTTAGTKVVPGVAASLPYGLTVAWGKVYFGATLVSGCAAPPAGLYVSDGTRKGTALLADQTDDFGGPDQLMSAGNKVFAVSQGELWSSDGTPAGTRRIHKFGSDIHAMTRTAQGNILLFASSGLWQSDGTHAGTEFIAAVAGASPDDAGPPVTMGGDLYFNGCVTPCSGGQLWRSDGTTLGTQVVANIYPDGDAYPESLANIAGTLYFNADDGVHGRELWTYSP